MIRQGLRADHPPKSKWDAGTQLPFGDRLEAHKAYKQTVKPADPLVRNRRACTSTGKLVSLVFLPKRLCITYYTNRYSSASAELLAIYFHSGSFLGERTEHSGSESIVKEISPLLWLVLKSTIIKYPLDLLSCRPSQGPKFPISIATWVINSMEIFLELPVGSSMGLESLNHNHINDVVIQLRPPKINHDAINSTYIS